MLEMADSQSRFLKPGLQSSIICALCISLFETFQIVISTSMRYIEPLDVFFISGILFVSYSIIWSFALIPAAFLLKGFLQKRGVSGISLITACCSLALLLYEFFWVLDKVMAEGLMLSSYGAFYSFAQIILAVLIAYAVYRVIELLRGKGYMQQFGFTIVCFYVSVIAYMMLYIYLKSSFSKEFNNPLYSVALFVLFMLAFRIMVYVLKKVRPSAVLSVVMSLATGIKIILFVSVSVITVLCFAYYSLAKQPDISNKPNILFISIDTLRSDRLSCYGETERMTSPNIDRLAKSGYLFKKSYSPATWTLPGHASMMTAMFPSSHKADRTVEQTTSSPVTPLPSSAVTLAETLNDNGYLTAGIISNPFVSSTFGMDQGFQFYDDRIDLLEDIRYFSLKDNSMLFKILKFMKVIDSNDYDGERRVQEVNRIGLSWLKENKDRDKPFFLFLHYNEPHFIYDPPSPYNMTADGRIIPYFYDIETLNKGQYSLSSKGLGDLLALYDGEITYLDHYLGEIFKKLEDWDLTDNTIVIITSDHGESFYEHEVWQHGNSLYEEQIRVPFIIHYPKAIPAGVVDDEHIVQLTDLMPTILDLVNISIPENVQGRSLLPIFKGNRLLKFDLAFAELRPDIVWKSKNPRYGDGIKAVINREWKYISYDSGKEELFNLAGDPHESNNLASKKHDKVNELRMVLDSWSSEITTQRADKIREINRGRLQQLRSLGYLN